MPQDTAIYETNYVEFDINVIKGSPTISWSGSSTANSLVQGDSLSEKNLNATANMNGVSINDQGNIGYKLDDGRVVSIGSKLGNPGTYRITFTWTPKDPNLYNQASYSANFTVKATASTPPAPPARAPSPVITSPRPAQTDQTGGATPPAPPAAPVDLSVTGGELEIRDLILEGTDRTSAILSWKTNKPARATVYYGPDSTYGYSETQAELKTTHSILLKGDILEPGTYYHAKVEVVDDKGGKVESSDFRFKTRGLPVSLVLLSKDGKKAVPAGTKVIFGEEEGVTDANGSVYFSDAPTGEQKLSYVLASKELSASVTVDGEATDEQKLSVRTVYGSSSGSIIWLIPLLLIFMVGLIGFAFWFWRRRNNGDGGYYDNPGLGTTTEDYYAQYGQSAGQSYSPEQTFQPNSQNGAAVNDQGFEEITPQPVEPELPPSSGNKHGYPWQ